MKTKRLGELYDIVEHLQRADAFPHPTEKFEVIETHISIVLLTGEYAYKLKKPVDLGFLDFSTAEKRERLCHEEVRLNRRLAPDIYLEVVTVTEGERGPVVGGTGPVLWHAVKMRQFAHNRELDVLVPRGELKRAHVDALAVEIAHFHQRCPPSPPDSAFGSPGIVAHYILECFEQTQACLHGEQREKRFAVILEWVLETLRVKSPDLLVRKRDGFVREGHGDLHLHNMLLLDDRVVPFDCLEFNAELRWIDVMSDIAFLLMDLDYYGHHELAAAFLSGYLETSGDYEGLGLLRLYQVYRAMVRTKVACIREMQELEAGEPTAVEDHEVNRHLDLAHACLRRPSPRLLITCGLSGSGKSTVAGAVLGPLGAIRIRSDVERKRLAGLEEAENGGSEGIGQGLYSAGMNARTYQRLLDLADSILSSGWSVIVDAAFLKRSEREEFLALARRRAAPFAILYCKAPMAVLGERVRQRAIAGTDPSDADVPVLAHQSAFAELPSEEEREWLIEVDTAGEFDVRALKARIEAV